MNDIAHERRPVFLGPNTMICMTVFNNENGFNEMWMSDYIDHSKEVKATATAFVDNISDLFSVALLWELREALAVEIQKHNKEFGTNFPVDKPADKP